MSAAPFSSSASATPGSGCRIRLSPIRNASNPASRKPRNVRTRRDSALRHPHHACRNPLHQIAIEVSALTSKVFRSRLFTPIASAPVVAQRIEHAVQLFRGVHLHQHVEHQRRAQPQPSRFNSASLSAAAISRIASARCARASTIWYSSTMKSLRRQGSGAAADASLQVAQAALKIRLVGQHRKRRRAARAISPRQPRRVKRRANQAL